MRRLAFIFSYLLVGFSSLIYAATPLRAQEMPSEYRQVLDYLGRKGDFAANVLKVNIPRSDLQISVAGVATPTPFGFGGWVAMTKGDGGHEVMMGDLVLLQQEVNSVMTKLRAEGLEISAVKKVVVVTRVAVIFGLALVGWAVAAAGDLKGIAACAQQAA